jgi:uncharacterized protein RhaS with RHS repeats
MARWIRPDPAGTADGLDLYCMVRNNPATYYDRAWPLPAYVEMAERVGANRVYQIPAEQWKAMSVQQAWAQQDDKKMIELDDIAPDFAFVRDEGLVPAAGEVHARRRIFGPPP